MLATLAFMQPYKLPEADAQPGSSMLKMQDGDAVHAMVGKFLPASSRPTTPCQNSTAPKKRLTFSEKVKIHCNGFSILLSLKKSNATLYKWVDFMQLTTQSNTRSLQRRSPINPKGLKSRRMLFPDQNKGKNWVLMFIGVVLCMSSTAL